LIEDGDSIYLDAGTTIFEIIPFIKDKEITVVTNGLTHIDALLQTRSKLYILGGEVKVKTSALIGGTALKALEQFRFDKCFIGTNGIHDSLGYSTPDPDEAYVKQKAIEYSDQAFVLADASKFSQTSFSKFANLEDATIITDLSKPEILKVIELKTTVKVVTIS
jgi:DeoR family fructose operon transcriptional repressor